jgi:hypothetical protein
MSILPPAGPLRRKSRISSISVIESAQRQDASADPNQTVQAFIDLCARHEANWNKALMSILPPAGPLRRKSRISSIHPIRDWNRPINQLIKWHEDRKRWHLNKTRQKMAAEGTSAETILVDLAHSSCSLEQSIDVHFASGGAIAQEIENLFNNQLIKWHEDRKRWHLNKTRQKMAAEGTSAETIPGGQGLCRFGPLQLLLGTKH